MEQLIAMLGDQAGSAGAGVLGAGAMILGDLIGKAFAEGDRKRAEEYLQQGIRAFGPEFLNAPGVAELTPQFGESAFAGVQADPRAVSAQQETLADLRRLSRPGNLESQAAFNEAEAQANQLQRGREGALQQSLLSRGLGGSGLAFALRQQAGQDAATAGSQRAFDAARAQRGEALQALGQYGTLAGDIRGQSFGEQTRKAQAADEMAKLRELGRVSGQQAAFDNVMRLQGARAGAAGAGVGFYGGRADDTQRQWGNYGEAAGQAIGGVGTALDDEAARKRREADDEAARKRRGG